MEIVLLEVPDSLTHNDQHQDHVVSDRCLFLRNEIPPRFDSVCR